MIPLPITFEEPKPIRLSPCKGMPVRLSLVPKTAVKISGNLGVPGPYGVGIVSVTAEQEVDGTVTLYFLLSNGQIQSVSYAGGGNPKPIEKLLSGDADVIASVTASLEAFSQISATANGTANVNALLDIAYRLNGQADVKGSAFGSLKADADLTSSAKAQANIAAILAMTIQIASSATAKATASGFLTVGANLNLMATATAISTANGSIALNLSIEGTAQGYALATGSLAASIDVASNASGTSTASGVIDAALALMANSQGTGTATGAILAAAALASTANGRGTATGNISAVAGGYDTDSQAYFTAMTVQPDDNRKGVIDTLVKGLKADGVWAKLDWLCLLAAHDAQAGRLNAKRPNKTLAVSNGPVFTTDRGFKGDGTAAHLTFGEAFNATGSAYALSSAHLGTWVSLQGAMSGARPLIGSSQSTRSYILPSSSGAGEARINDSTAMNLGVAETLLGGRVMSRTAANARAYYRDGTLNQSDTAASTAIATGPAYVLRNGSVYADDRLSAISTGQGLTAAEVQTLHNRVTTYLTAIGAN